MDVKRVLLLMDDVPYSYINELRKRNCELIFANNLKQGIERLKKEKFDLIITDIAKDIENDEEGFEVLFSLNRLPPMDRGEVISIVDDPASAGSLTLFSNIKHFIEKDEPVDVFIAVVDRVLDDLSVREQLNAFDDPQDALFNDAVKAIARGTDPESIAKANKILKKILKDRPDKKYPHSKIIRGYAYDELKDIVSTERIFSLRPSRVVSTSFFVKNFGSTRRAKCEYVSYLQIRQHNMDLEEKLKDFSLSEEEIFYWKNVPKINKKRLLSKPHSIGDVTFITVEAVRGPTLDQIANEVNQRISKKDKKAIEFKKRTTFELSKLLAWFQINEIKTPEDEKYEIVDFAANLKSTFADNLAYLNTEFSSTELSCLKKCIKIITDKLKGTQDTQYHDFNPRNVAFEARNDDATFEDLLDIAEKEGKSIKEFVQDRLYKLDFNKTFRKTNKFEDILHTSVETKFKSKERKIFDTHFLLYRKKFELLKKLKEQIEEPEYDESKGLPLDVCRSPEKIKKYKTEIKNLNNLIEKLENNKKIQRTETLAIHKLIAKEKSELSNIASYVSLYRDFRWFDHFLRKYLAKTAAKHYEDNPKYPEIINLEKELNYLCSNSKRSLKSIIHKNNREISNRHIPKSKHKFLNRAELNKETAEAYLKLLEETKSKTGDIEKIRYASEYIAAKYMLAVLKKIGKLEIDYQKLIPDYKDE